MKKLNGIIAAIGAVMFVGALTATTVSAEAVYRANEKSNSIVAKSETVDGSAYLAGNSVRVSGTVKGDVYCAGSSIMIDGTVDGDVLCAGSNVTVNGTVKGDVRLAGAMVTLGGIVMGNASVFGADVLTDSSLQLGGDLTGGAGNLTIDGIVGRDMTAGAETLTINGTIGRDVMSGFTNVEFGEGAAIKGNFAYNSDQEASIPGDVVAGKTDFTMIDNQSKNNSAAARSVAGVISVLAIGLLAVLGIILMPRQVHAASDVAWGKFGIAVVVGLTFIVIAPIAALMLLVTGVGGVIAYALILTWLLVMALSPVTFAYFVGSKVYGNKSPNILIRATVGALLLMLVLLLPIVNIFVFIVMVLSGVGMIFLGVPKLYAGSPYQVAKASAKKKEAA